VAEKPPSSFDHVNVDLLFQSIRSQKDLKLLVKQGRDEIEKGLLKLQAEKKALDEKEARLRNPEGFLKDIREGKYTSVDYLSDLFQKGELDYYANVKKKCLARGLEESPLLSEYLFLVTLNHRFHIEYIRKTALTPELREEALLNVVLTNQTRIGAIEKDLAAIAKQRIEAEDLTKKHKLAIELAVKFVKENVGMFAITCAKCNTVIMADGGPHWALYTDEIDGTKYIFIWSKELWRLVLQKTIPVSIMAFILKTSIVGLQFTCKQRGEKWPEEISIEDEEVALKKMNSDYAEAEKAKQTERIDAFKI